MSQFFVPAFKSLRVVIVLFFSIFVFWVIAVRSPSILRPLSMLLRTGYTLVVPAVYIVLYLGFRLKGWLGDLFSLLLISSVLALALAGVWASGLTESGLLSGVIPMFDSANYYSDSLRLLAGQEFSAMSTQRPLFSAFFAFLLWVTNHDLLHALALLTLLVALACYLLVKEIHKTHGPAIAAFIFVFIFIYYRYHSGVVRTENLGILFGVLGTALIWRGISNRHQFHLLAGILLTSIGMIARAGAFFILPLLVLWGAVFFRQKGKLISWRFMAAAMVAVAVAFFANQLTTNSFGASDVVPFGNFSYSFYGLASGGKSWAYVLEIYPQASPLEIYKMAIQVILERPGLLVKGVIYNYAMFFSNTNYGLFSYMGGEGEIISAISYWILLLLSLLGIWNWFQHRKDPYLGFVMVSAIGLLLSVPFLQPTDTFRLRAYATSIVILALLPSMGLHGIFTKLKMDKLNPRIVDLDHENYLVVFSIFVLAIVILGPFASKGTDQVPELGQSNCEAGLIPVVVRYDPGGMVHLVSQNTLLLDRAPNYHIGTFRRSVHGFPNFNFMSWALDSITPNHTLFSALDYRSFRPVLAVVKSDTLPSPPALLELCGIWEENSDIVQFNVFYVSTVSLIDRE
jgi:hypothetical protein